MLRPRIFQVEPCPDFTVSVYFDDGTVKLYDARPLIKKGGIYAPLGDLDFFISRCVVMNNTLAWDMSGNWDSTECVDICPDLIYQQN
ncbi:MAG: DUF2442 domain-containing protein [Defluviitaleaceae bacterium]|nr:DUF2442 domain-containing protein [Defluviitaleaceae bacterium]